MIPIKYFIADDSNHEARKYRMDFIGAFPLSNVKHRVFVKLNNIYGDYFP